MLAPTHDFVVAAAIVLAACSEPSAGSASDAGGADVSAGDASSGDGDDGGGGSRDATGGPTDGPIDAGASCGVCQPPETCGGGGVPTQCGHPACASGQWSTAVAIDSPPFNTNLFSAATSIAADATGGVHIAYTAGGALKYANRAPGQTTWSLEAVPLPAEAGTPTVEDLTIAVDVSGIPHIACVDGNHLVYATRSGPGNWKVEDAFSPINKGVSLDLDPNGAPHVGLLFDGRLADGHYDIQAGHLSRPVAGGPWTIEALGVTPDDATPIVRIVGSEVHVVFDPTTKQLVDAHRPLAGGSWTQDAVSSQFLGGMTSLVVDPATGDLHSVHNATDGLRDAHRAASSTTWTDDLVVPLPACSASSCVFAEFGGMLIDTWGGIHVSYETDAHTSGSCLSDESLVYSARPSGSTTWTTTTQAQTSRFPMFNAMAIDPFNGVHLAYAAINPLSKDPCYESTAAVMYQYLCP